MANLEYNKIHGTKADITRNLDYVKSAHGDLPADDVARVAMYVQGDHADKVFARSYNCSKEPVLAAEEFMALRDIYWQNRKSQKGKGSEKEVLAYHLYFSFAEGDKVTSAEMQEIWEEWLVAVGLDKHKAISAVHTNAKHKHIHGTICAYDPDGKGKIADSYALEREWRRQLNYICAERGLSIIENKYLHGDKEYAEWFERIQQEGQITIHKALTTKERKEYYAELNRRGYDLDKKPILSEEEIEVELLKDYFAMAEEDTKQVKLRIDSFARVYMMPDYKRIYVYKYDHGRRRGNVELACILAGMLVTGKTFDEFTVGNWDAGRMTEHYTQKMRENEVSKAVALARQYDIESIEEVEERRKECGMDMNSLKRAGQGESEEMRKLNKRYRDLMYLKGYYERYTSQQFANDLGISKAPSFEEMLLDAHNRSTKHKYIETTRDR